MWVKIRASEAERAEWHANARSAGLTLSDLVRRSVGRVPTWTAPVAEVERTRQVARIGNNLKQIARWANTFASEAEAVEVVAEGLSPPFNSWPAAADDAAGQPGGHRRRDSGDDAPRSLPRQRRGKLGVQRGAQRPLGQTAIVQYCVGWLLTFSLRLRWRDGSRKRTRRGVVGPRRVCPL